MKIGYLFLAIFFLLPNISSADETSEKKVDFSTPYGPVYIHLSNLQKDNYNPGIASTAFRLENPGSKASQKIARKLKAVLDARGLFVVMDDIPTDKDYIDTISGKHRYILFDHYPNIYLEKKDGKWKYSKHTVSHIPSLYAETFPISIDELREILPEFAFNKFLGIQIWQYAGIVIYFILSFLIYYLFRWIFGIFLIRIASKLPFKGLADKFIQPISNPLSFLLVLILLSLFLPILTLPVKMNMIFSYAIRALIPFTGTLIIYRLSDLFSDFLGKLAGKTSTTVDDNLVPLARKAFKIFVVAFGGIFILENIDIPVTPLLAGISIGGLAFALAAQDTIKNLFGSVTIFTDQPFEVGDWIVFSGNEGTVEEVGVRSTRVRTFYNSLISIPNGKLSDMTIDNMGRRQYRRYVSKIGLTYDTPPEKLDAFVSGLKEIIAAHPNTRKDYYQIHLNDLGATSIEILFYIFFDVPDWTAELEARHQVINEVIRLAQALEVRFAFPTSTLHIEDFPGSGNLTPLHNTDMNNIDNKLKSFVSDINQRYPGTE